MRFIPGVRAFGLGLGALALAAAGLVTSSLVSIGLWIGLAVSGGAINSAVILGVTVGIAGWLGALFLVIRLGRRALGETLTPTAEKVLAGCIVGGVVVGALARKALQILRPDLLPPPEAYAWLTVAIFPAAAGAFWALSGQPSKQ